MKKCNQCGQSYPDEVEICPNCNTSLVKEAPPLGASGAPISRRILIFSAIAVVYCALASFLACSGAQKAAETHITGMDALLGMLLWILGGIPMGIGLALCLKGTAAKMKPVMIGSILCSAIMALAMYVGFYATGEYRELLIAEKVGKFFSLLGFEVLAAGIPCFLIAGLCRLISRKKKGVHKQ